MRQLKRFEASMAASLMAVGSAVMLGGGTASADGNGSASQSGGTMSPLSVVTRRCDHTPTGYTRPAGDGQGFAVIGSNGNNVHADVTLQGGSSDTQYMVRLIQMPRSPAGTCSAGSAGTTVAPMFSDGGGNASLSIDGPMMSGATGAWIYIEGPMGYRTPFGEYYTTDAVIPI
jgi:hypothetical protein